ncbi:hypothetical protein C8J57DRAFT_1521254 [Mycena rebaudengoi]|nr:hypothetical protein C8J57DRAFT_1521254 [Mycena rebaudengoi]
MTSEATAQCIKAALKALDELPWDGVVKGFRAGGSVEDLVLWFTTDWLRSDHEDHMLELLASDLRISDGSPSSIQTTFFTAIVWVALGINFEKSLIGYGNRFRTAVPVSLKKHLIWWLFKHLGLEFKWTDIPVPKQTDPHSCGILMYFALAHWFDSERFLLPECTAASMVDERIKMFLQIVEPHRRKVGNFMSNVQDYEFTFVHLLGDDEEPEGTDKESSLLGSEYSCHETKPKSKTRHPSGRKKKNPVHRAKYVNWATPFSWSAITLVQAKVGWGHSNIIQELQHINYDFFQHLTKP